MKNIRITQSLGFILHHGVILLLALVPVIQYSAFISILTVVILRQVLLDDLILLGYHGVIIKADCLIHLTFEH